MKRRLYIITIIIISSVTRYISCAASSQLEYYNYFELEAKKEHLVKHLHIIEEHFIKSQNPNMRMIRECLSTTLTIRPNNLKKRIQSAKSINELKSVNRAILTTQKILSIFTQAPTIIMNSPLDDKTKDLILQEITHRFYTMHLVAYWLNLSELSEEDFTSTLNYTENILAQFKIFIPS